MKVIFLGCTEEQRKFGNNSGNPDELIIGTEYEVVIQKVYAWHTQYCLAGHYGSFNSVCFEEKGEGDGRQKHSTP